MRAKLATNSARRRWLVLAVTVAAQFMVIVDVSVVNVALPTIKDDLHFSQESLQWVITSYSILFGGTLLLGGRLADLLGRRRLFMTGVAVFTLGSLLSGLAWSEGALIVTRGLQGLGGALLAPAALSIVVTTFREGRERNVALAVWGAVSGSRRRGRRAARRHSHLVPELVVDLLRQPAGRRRRPRCQPVALERESGRARASAFRPRRRHLDHRRPDGARLRDHPDKPAWLEQRCHGRPARDRRRTDRSVRRDRGSLAGAAATAADLPPADALGGQRDHSGRSARPPSGSSSCSRCTCRRSSTTRRSRQASPSSRSRPRSRSSPTSASR